MNIISNSIKLLIENISILEYKAVSDSDDNLAYAERVSKSFKLAEDKLSPKENANYVAYMTRKIPNYMDTSRSNNTLSNLDNALSKDRSNTAKHNNELFDAKPIGNTHHADNIETTVKHAAKSSFDHPVATAVALGGGALIAHLLSKRKH